MNLKAELKSRGYNLSRVARALGIHRASLHNKLSGKREFRVSEVMIIREMLNLSDAETVRLFLSGETDSGSEA